MTLIKSISGIRGTIGGRAGDTLNPLDIVKFTSAYATLIRRMAKNDSNRIVVGRDARISGEMVKNVVCGTLMGMGFDVVNIGLASTPTTEVAVTMEGAAGGIIITASHNPRQWNALKLLNEKGMNLNKDDVLKKQYTNGWCAAFCPIPFPYGAYSWGSVMSNLADLVRSYGFTPHINTAPEMIDIKRLLNDNKLLLVGLRTASGAHHFQIIYGYYISGGVVYYRVHDPYGNYCVAWTESYLRSRIYAVDTTDYLCRQVRGIMWL